MDFFDLYNNIEEFVPTTFKKDVLREIMNFMEVNGYTNEEILNDMLSEYDNGKA